MAKATTDKAVRPLDELRRLLPKITHDELLDLVAASQAELGARATAYVDAIAEIDAVPSDLVNEALAFAVRARDLLPTLARASGAPLAVADASDAIREAINYLKEERG